MTHNSTSTVPYERFVPQGGASLVEDAPGWGHAALPQNATQPAKDTASSGPTCWKCRGSGLKKRHTDECPVLPCSVCTGRGRLLPKKLEAEGATRPGKITRGRRCPAAWTVKGPAPHALQLQDQWSDMLVKAQTLVDVEIPLDDDDTFAATTATSSRPSWVPRQGEELCNLVGSWRILQRVGSHRWTTDDLVTAFVAARELATTIAPPTSTTAAKATTTTEPLQYLDLGTGNASVMQMLTWAALGQGHESIQAVGVEARSEAVHLARRSLSFNLGPDATANIVHGDFRDTALKTSAYDLVTGTPPYFRVDFSVSSDEQVVETATIRQGGMPTARQSAPARCEFRGGIEAYCAAAAVALKAETGRFVVCENWANHDRVLIAAKESSLQILRQMRVQGREGRDTLFCVYVMNTKGGLLSVGDGGGNAVGAEPIVECIAVRDANGFWTEQYTQTVLASMSIPNAEAVEKSS